MGASMLRLLTPLKTPLLTTTSFRTRFVSEPSAARFSSQSQRSMSVKQTIDDLVANNKVVVFSKSYCPYCKKAKATLRELTSEENIKILELDSESNGDEIQAYLYQKSGQSTVPNIYINQTHIGGNDNLQAKHKRGEIVPLIAA